MMVRTLLAQDEFNFDSSAATDATVALFVVIVLLLAVTGFMAADVSKSKGGSFVRGFLSGFIFGPIGVFYIGFLNPGRPCANCKWNAPKSAAYCPHCGQLVAAAGT